MKLINKKIISKRKVFDLKIQKNHNYEITRSNIPVHNSGKGFVIKNFMEGRKYKVRDVDEWKKSFLKLEKLKGKWPEIRNLDLRNPKDVFQLHKFIKKKDIKNKTLDLLLTDLKQDRLPNIIFDVTLKEIDDISEVLPTLLQLGYDQKNVHLVWVLANYRIAVERNAERDRVVPEDILLHTHEGAARSVYDIITGRVKGLGVDGKINVVLNNEENTIFYPKDYNYFVQKKLKEWGFDKLSDLSKKDRDKLFKEIDTDLKGQDYEKGPVIKDFLYLNIKERGKGIKNEDNVKQQIFNWIKNNVPKTKLTKDMFG